MDRGRIWSFIAAQRVVRARNEVKLISGRTMQNEKPDIDAIHVPERDSMFHSANLIHLISSATPVSSS